MKKLLVLFLLLPAGLTAQNPEMRDKLQHLLLGGSLPSFFQLTDTGIVISTPVVKKLELFIPAADIPAVSAAAAALKGNDYYAFYDSLVAGTQAVAPTRLPLSGIPPDPRQPLRGKKIAIDPGHTASDTASARIEQKFIRIPDQADRPPDYSLIEAELNLVTALLLKDSLEKLGAEVLLTREEPGSSQGLSYSEWLKAAKMEDIKLAFSKNMIDYEVVQELRSAASHDRKLFTFYNNMDLYHRAQKINDFNPDAVVIIHYNVDVDNAPWIAPTRRNYSMVFIPGGFDPNSHVEFNRKTHRADFLRLLLTDQWESSFDLASAVQKCFVTKLGVPAAGEGISYIDKFTAETSEQGVFSRNLSMTRLVHAPLVYGEPLYQDNVEELKKLTRVAGYIERYSYSERVSQVAECYLDGLMYYFTAR